MSEESEPVEQIRAEVANPPAGDPEREPVGEVPRPISAPVMARIFLEIGASSFGGIAPSLAVIERELVEKRSILTEADVAEAVAATRLLPGSTLIQVTSFLGYRMRGWTGSTIATLACLLPPACAMLALAALSESLPSHVALEPAGQGLAAAVVGLLLASMWRFGRATFASPVATGIGLGALGSALVLRVPAALVVVAAGLIGIRWLSTPGRERAGGPRQRGLS